jgi:hypothetical protein
MSYLDLCQWVGSLYIVNFPTHFVSNIVVVKTIISFFEAILSFLDVNRE